VSLPRQILPGTTYLVTRRVSQRQFLLLPSAAINQIVLYCVALAAEETGVLVHAVCALSNHIHLVVTDPHARLPHFSYVLFKYVAKCVNAHRGRWENLFAGGVQPSYVRLADEQAMLDKFAYVVANPVEAGLVRSSAHWPGVNLWRAGTYKVRRPPVFFRNDGTAPASLKLGLAPLPLEGLPRRDILELVGQAVVARETEIRARHKAAKRAYLGVARVVAQKPTDSPFAHAPRRRLSPRVATRDKLRRIEALQRLKDFCDDYKVARQSWCAGHRHAVFPAGVYKMRLEYGVRCAEH